MIHHRQLRQRFQCLQCRPLAWSDIITIQKLVCFDNLRRIDNLVYVDAVHSAQCARRRRLMTFFVFAVDCCVKQRAKFKDVKSQTHGPAPLSVRKT